MARFGAKCLLALHKENTLERNIMLDVAGKQAVIPESGHEAIDGQKLDNEMGGQPSF
jgi:hypothetical protein